MSDDQLPSELEGSHEFTYSDYINLAEPECRSTDTMTIDARGRKWTFEIFTDGESDPEVWTRLSAALLYGNTQAMLAKIKKEEYAEKIRMPDGKMLTIKDPSYIGSVKVLSEVIISPKLTLVQLFQLGHKLGRVFTEVCDWACEKNGLTADAIEKMNKLLKNA